jgi:hypothetical protein
MGKGLEANRKRDLIPRKIIKKTRINMKMRRV